MPMQNKPKMHYGAPSLSVEAEARIREERRRDEASTRLAGERHAAEADDLQIQQQR